MNINWRRIVRIFLFLGIFMSFSSLFLGKWFFIFDLFSHFQLQYLLGILLVAGILLFMKDWGGLFVAFFYAICLFFSFIYPFNLFATENEKDIDVFYFNMFYGNEEPELVAEGILEQRPGIVVLVEANMDVREELTDVYGEPVLEFDQKQESVLVFSKFPVLESYVVEEFVFPIFVVEFENFYLLVVHPMPPINAFVWKQQVEFFIDLKAYIEKLDKNFLLTGDFNSTFYSVNFRNNFEEYFKKNVYSWGLDTPLMIPIDHALSNIDLEVKRGKNLNSDHWPLLIDFESTE